MKKVTLLLTLGLIVIFSTNAIAQTPDGNRAGKQKNAKHLKQHDIQKMDKHLNKKRAVERKFKSHKEFKRMQREYKRTQRKMHRGPSSKYYDRSMGDRKPRRGGHHYSDEYVYYDDDRSYRSYHRTRQHGYRHYRRGWYLAYRYDRASFYDRYGYYYGYFNRYGYYFEDVFYRYDRYYTYRDRLRGRGLFDYRYYVPHNSRYYGFCE